MERVERPSEEKIKEGLYMLVEAVLTIGRAEGKNNIHRLEGTGSS